MGGTGERGLIAPGPVEGVRAALDGLGHGTAVVLAVSGGPDSIGLAHLVAAARPDLAATLVHVRHGLRDDTGDADVALRHADELGVPRRVVAVEVGGGRGPEDAARSARLSALHEAALDCGATAVLTGHTADDQAETVLLNIARGAGLPGLAGMAVSRPLGRGVTLLHPLLGLRRDTVREVAVRTGLPIAADPTNDDDRQRRVRARSQLLPLLASLTGGGTDPVVALQRLAVHARRDTEALDLLAADRFSARLLRWGPVVAVPASSVDGLPDALATRVARLLLAAVADRADPASSEVVDAVLALRDGQEATVPGAITVSRGGGLLAAAPSSPAALAQRSGVGRIDLPELGLAVEVDAQVDPVLPPWAPREAATAVPVPQACRVTVRTREPGDRVRTAAGTQVVADAMADAGVPRAARHLVPVISDAAGVLWVPGVAVRAAAQGPSRLQLSPAAGK